MRTFTLVMGTFNLEVEETEEKKDGFKVYSAKCEKVGFSVDGHTILESLLFPFCEYLVKKHLKYQRDPSKLIYRGFTLELEYHYHPSSTYVGICKEIGFEDNIFFDALVDTFLDKVDEYLEKTMKAQFTVVYEGFTLEVWQEKEKKTNMLLWHGKCPTLNFNKNECSYRLEDLVHFFQGEVDEYLKPTEIEYRGHKLEVSLSKEIENKFEGYSDICDGWTTLQSTKEEVIDAFKVRVDATHRINIQSLESAVTKKQDELEDYFRTQGYVFDVPVLRGNHYYLYAIHPDYYEKWKLDSGSDFPKDKVVFIRQQ